MLRFELNEGESFLFVGFRILAKEIEQPNRVLINIRPEQLPVKANSELIGQRWVEVGQGFCIGPYRFLVRYCSGKVGLAMQRCPIPAVILGILELMADNETPNAEFSLN